MKVHRLTGSIGAMLELDLGSSDAVPAVRSALATHCVIVLRGKFMTPDDLVRFGRRFGSLVMTIGTEKELNANDKGLTSHDAHENVLRVRNMGKAQAVTENWHADNIFSKNPTAISILAAEALPEVGGDTMFSNQFLAYETLSTGMKRLLRGARMKHTAAAVPAYRDMAPDAAPHAVHPIVPLHREAQRPYLLIGGRAAPHRLFLDMTLQESSGLHNYLFEHSVQPDRVYRHKWEAGDVVIWDNRATMHYAIHDYGDAVRDMNRVTIGGEAPIPYDE